MVRWIILACGVVVLTITGTFALLYEPNTAAPSPAAFHQFEGAQPKLKLVGQAVYDFGTMPKKTESSHSWEIQNVGEGELALWLVDTSCSCTVAKLQDEKKTLDPTAKKQVRVPPGGSTSIEVTWDTKNWTKFGQTATLGTNDLDNPSFSLSIRGLVLFPVEVEPSDTIALSTISNEETSRSNLTILSPDWAGLKLTKVTSSKPDLIVADIKPMTPEELKSRRVLSGFHVVVEVKPGMPLATFREELVFQTDHPKKPELKVTVAGKVTGPISVVPQKLQMSTVASETGASGDLSLIVRGGKETHFQVAYAPGKLQVAIAPDDRPGMKGRYQMKVTVPPGSPSGFIDDRIILKTDHPKVGELKIPVTLYISRSNSG